MRLPLVAGLGGAALMFVILALAVGIGGGEVVPGSATTAPRESSAGRGLAVFAEMGCGSCHTLAAAGSTGTFGPNLDERLPMHTRASLVARIMARPGAIEDMAGMPTNFRTRLNDRELNHLVDFLLAARGG